MSTAQEARGTGGTGFANILLLTNKLHWAEWSPFQATRVRKSSKVGRQFLPQNGLADSTSCTHRWATPVVYSNCPALRQSRYTSAGDTEWQPRAWLKLSGR